MRLWRIVMTNPSGLRACFCRNIIVQSQREGRLSGSRVKLELVKREADATRQCEQIALFLGEFWVQVDDFQSEVFFLFP